MRMVEILCKNSNTSSNHSPFQPTNSGSRSIYSIYLFDALLLQNSTEVQYIIVCIKPIVKLPIFKIDQGIPNFLNRFLAAITKGSQTLDSGG